MEITFNRQTCLQVLLLLESRLSKPYIMHDDEPSSLESISPGFYEWGALITASDPYGVWQISDGDSLMVSDDEIVIHKAELGVDWHIKLKVPVEQ